MEQITCEACCYIKQSYIGEMRFREEWNAEKEHASYRDLAAVRLPKLQKNTQVCQKGMNSWTSSFLNRDFTAHDLH